MQLKKCNNEETKLVKICLETSGQYPMQHSQKLISNLITLDKQGLPIQVPIRYSNKAKNIAIRVNHKGVELVLVVTAICFSGDSLKIDLIELIKVLPISLIAPITGDTTSFIPS